ncbi:MAG: toprim domain-containing protein, partial [Chloroflexota bacterium]
RTGRAAQRPESPAIFPPSDDWQKAACAVVCAAEDTLWSAEGEPAMIYLLNRGLQTDTIRRARLGYVPGGIRGWRHLHGLDVPCGILIPWFASDQVWAVKVRRASGNPKYVQIAGGSTDGLYNADTLTAHHTAVFCEGEFDALVLQQEAGDLLAPVTLGSASARLSRHWHDRLVGQRAIFVCYDQDTAGERGMNRLLKLSPRFQPLLLPEGKDVTDFHLNGGDVHEWVTRARVPDEVEAVK